MSAPEFVAVGHVTLDRFGDQVRLGGAAYYAAVTAHRLGLSAGILTSHGADFPLEHIPPAIEVVSVPAAATTVFEYAPDGDKRTMRVTSTAAALRADDVPADWEDAQVVVLAPVLGEVDPAIVAAFSSSALATAAQGWLRGLARDGAVGGVPWAPAAPFLARLQALFLSVEDVGGQVETVMEWMQQVPVGAVTAGADGAFLFVNGERYTVRPRPTHQVDATGAGDVFAAAFLVQYHLHGDPWQAAAAAACVASLAVEGVGADAIPDRAALDAALAAYMP